jgi:hypothetical protein
MDHHDEWQQWSEDDHGLGDADTADLDNHLGDHLGDPGGQEHLDAYDDLNSYDPQPDEPAPDLGPMHAAPDLFHDGDDGDDGDRGYDAGQHPDYTDADASHDDPSHDDPSHDDPSHDDPSHSGDPDPDDGSPDPQHHDPADTSPIADGTDPHDPGHPDDGFDDPGQHDVPAEHLEQLVGTDPDAPMEHHGFHDGDFPPPLDLDHRPDPTDGYPWADPDTLGDPDTIDHMDHISDTYAATGGVPAGDLFAYAGMDAAPPGVDPWNFLLGSDDPATSSLARFWGPLGE